MSVLIKDIIFVMKAGIEGVSAKTMLSDYFAKRPNFGMWVSVHLRSIALKFFPWAALRFREITFSKKAHWLEKLVFFAYALS